MSICFILWDKASGWQIFWYNLVMAHFLVFGTSIDHGYYDSQGGWVERLKSYLYEKIIPSGGKIHYTVYNLGISGDMTTGVLKRFDSEAAPRLSQSGEKNIVIFSVGANDSQRINVTKEFKVPMEDFKKNLQELVNKAKKVTSEVIFLGLTPADESKVDPIPWAPEFSYLNNSIKNYDTAIKAICEKENLLFIDLFAEFQKLDYKKLLVDGVHPNTEGHAKFYEIVKEKLQESNLIE